MNRDLTRIRLILMVFLEFAVWGIYLSSIGRYLDHIGFGTNIKWFFAMQGIVALFMPTIIGIIADKYIQAQKMLSLCQLVAGTFLIAAGLYCKNAGTDVRFAPFFILSSISQAFFMPTVALTNAVSYHVLTDAGKDPVRYYPPIRAFGTVGFVCAMLLSNWMKIDGISMQDSYTQLIASGIISYVLCLYALTLPNCQVNRVREERTLAQRLGLNAFSLFRDRQFRVFLIFSMLLGAALKVTEAYASPFLNSFGNNPALADTFAVRNSNALLSISQISEALFILLIPYCMRKLGIRKVMLIAMVAWMLRFGLFAIGGPQMPRVIWLILSCVVYGIAFNFFDISASLFVESSVASEIRSSAQGLYMLMASGLGSVIGTIAAGSVVDHLVYNAATPDWKAAWLIFAAYSLVLAILFAFTFHPQDSKN